MTTQQASALFEKLARSGRSIDQVAREMREACERMAIPASECIRQLAESPALRR